MNKQLLAAALGVAAAITLIAGARVVPRYLALGRITALAHAEHRIQSDLTHRTPSSTQEPTHRVNLGYASFLTPASITFSAESTSDGSCVLLTSSDFTLAFLAPFSMHFIRADGASAMDSLPGAKTKHSSLVTLIDSYDADAVQGEIDIEHARYPSFWEVLTLRNDTFVARSLQLSHKVASLRGSNEVFTFLTPHTRGLVRIGDSPEDRTVASVSLASTEGDRNVGFHLRKIEDSERHIDEIMMTILASFAFTVDEIPSRAQLIDLIATTIIEPSKVPPQVPHSGTPEQAPGI